MFYDPYQKDIASGAGITTYETDSYSGSQIQVLFGDILIDTAVSISYQVVQNKTPLYSFASQYYKTIADGQVSIQGNLTITFKESGYLLLPAVRFHNYSSSDISTSPRFIRTKEGLSNQFGDFTSLTEASRVAHEGRVRYQNVENMVANMKQAEGEDSATYYGLIKQLQALDDSEFEHYAEEFEDAIWYGSSKQSPSTRDQLFSSNIDPYTSKIKKKDILNHRRLDQYPSVDILITYGDMEAPDQVNHTVQKLLDVQFTGEYKSIVDDGSPVMETYEFIARNRV